MWRTLVYLVLPIVGMSLASDPGSMDLNDKLERCVRENDVDSDMADRFVSPFFTTNRQEEKCFIKCIGTSLGYVNKNSGLITNVDKLPKDMVHAAIEGKCVDVRGSDPCDTAYLQFICITSISDPTAFRDYDYGYY